MKLVLKIFLGIVVVLVLIFAGGMFYITRNLDTGKVEIAEVNLANVDDGTYTGAYKAGRFTNELSVDVKDHKITDIKVLKDVAFSSPEVTKDVFSSVIDRQSTKIDIVSGASVTTKAYLKSVENALNK